MKKSLFICFLLSSILCSASFPVTFSGGNVPYDSSFHLGLVNGPGTGLDLGGDVFLPVADNFGVGAEIEYLMTNSGLEQNISMQKYGLVLKYVVNEDLFFTLHYGGCPFYVSKILDYVDSLSGEEYTIDEDTHGHASYIAFAPNIRLWDYFFTPKIAINRIEDGGAVLELDLNIGHRF